ncbi:hypothetical protein EGW08_021253 [Elysia chlorotica]|uniref:Timeless C-terminal domain-containing protein n=1 Tax=Elysia chlorotica TaxID=188477 RepID=A0A433SP52_ELYCH|nr:hypothetical protein EGW08_021253 [Elysia chlorotica]
MGEEEEEFMALKEIFMAALPRLHQSQPEDVEGEEEEDNDAEEEETRQMEASEAQFDFNGFINDFAHINVLKSYSILLREFSENSDTVNHCVVKMLHRLSHDLGYVGMLFQASIFKSFSALINGPYSKLPRFKELAKFATFVVRQFTNVARINKKIFVDMLFWKAKSEALAVTSGYDFSTKSKGKVLWTEHQEDELLGLYEKFRDVTHPELDTADLILGELTSNHTRVQVLRELKRQGLINSAADLRRKGKGRSRAWTETEIQELRDAFDLHKDSNYPISDIMTTLTGDRGRQAVTSKILELGLVAHKDELKKKRKGGRSGGGRRKRRGGSEDDDSEGERLFPDASQGRRQKGQSDESSDDSSGDESDDDDDNDDNEDEDNDDAGDADDAVRRLVSEASCSIADYVSRLVEQGYQEQIAWIARNLRNSAEDREEGVFSPTPIVPLSEENEAAMEDESFLVFLRCIGITPPNNQQELFWRIPAQFSPADLISMADGLEVTPSGQAANPEDVQRIVSRVLPNLQTHPPSRVDKKKAKEEKRRKKEEKMKRKEEKLKRKEEKRKMMAERRKENAKKAKKAKGANHDKLASLVKSADQPDDDSQLSDENEPAMFVPVIPRGAHGSDTSDSGLDSELEANEQRKLWKEKASEKGRGVSASDRREALRRMMARRNQKRNEGKNPGPTDGVEIPDNDKNVAAADHNRDGKELPALPQDVAMSDGGDKVTTASPTASVGVSGSKKRRIQQIESESDSDTSSLSSLSEADDGGEVEGKSETPRKDKSLHAEKSPRSSRKKRALNSDSDSDEPLARDKRKRQRNNSLDSDSDHGEQELNISTAAASVSQTSNKSESSDKENKDTDSQSQLNESLRLHFSSSDEEDNNDNADEDGDDKKDEEDNINNDEDGSEGNKGETPKESFPATMLTQGRDSDDSDDDHISLRAAVKRRRAAVIDSDED